MFSGPVLQYKLVDCTVVIPLYFHIYQILHEMITANCRETRLHMKKTCHVLYGLLDKLEAQKGSHGLHRMLSLWLCAWLLEFFARPLNQRRKNHFISFQNSP